LRGLDKLVSMQREKNEEILEYQKICDDCMRGCKAVKKVKKKSSGKIIIFGDLVVCPKFEKKKKNKE